MVTLDLATKLATYVAPEVAKLGVLAPTPFSANKAAKVYVSTTFVALTSFPKTPQFLVATVSRAHFQALAPPGLLFGSTQLFPTSETATSVKG